MPPKTSNDAVGQLAQRATSALIRREVASAFQGVIGLVNKAVQRIEQRIQTKLDSVRDGKDGARGPKGDKGDSVVGPRGPKGEKGDKGESIKGDPGTPGAPAKPVDPKEIARLTLPQLFEEIDRRLPLVGDAVRFSLEAQLKDMVAKAASGWGDGGGTSFSVMQSGTLKVQQPLSMNFTGAGAPTISVGSNGVTHLNFPSGGGGGFTALAATETPNGTTTVFTFPSASAQPSYLVVDNVWIKAVSKAGTVNWTWNDGTKKATLSVPAQDDVWGIV